MLITKAYVNDFVIYLSYLWHHEIFNYYWLYYGLGGFIVALFLVFLAAQVEKSRPDDNMFLDRIVHFWGLFFIGSHFVVMCWKAWDLFQIQASILGFRLSLLVPFGILGIVEIAFLVSIYGKYQHQPQVDTSR
ncbi:MAG: hypothetical protein WA705_18570 [Candidatus Ozemobacteraceae bacterium]